VVDVELVFCEAELEFLYGYNLDDSRSHSVTTAVNPFFIPSRASRPMFVCVCGFVCSRCPHTHTCLHTYVHTCIRAGSTA